MTRSALFAILLSFGCGSGGQTDAGAGMDSTPGDGGTSGMDGSMTVMEAGGSCSPATKGTCGAGLFCESADCVSGTCKPIPAASDAKQPVCGCDGITYWNASVAAGAGVGTKAAGACTMGVACAFMTMPCPASTYCAYDVMILPACTQQTYKGICWGLPATCPQSGDKKRACTKPTGQCPFECDALRAETPYWADNKCP